MKFLISSRNLRGHLSELLSIYHELEVNKDGELVLKFEPEGHHHVMSFPDNERFRPIHVELHHDERHEIFSHDLSVQSVRNLFRLLGSIPEQPVSISIKDGTIAIHYVVC